MSDEPIEHEMTEQYLAHMQQKSRVFPCHTNRASALGDPCERKLVYMRTRWKDALKPEPVLQSIFDLGSLFERHFVRVLEDLGYRVYEQQRALEFPEENITGHLDAVLGREEWGDLGHVADIKSCSTHIWHKINSLDDLVHAKQHHLRKYPAQITLYLLMKADVEEQRGVIIFVDKQTGVPKDIWVDLDLDYAESLLQKARRINEHVEAGTMPDRIPYTPHGCGRCEYRHICVPDITSAEAIVWLDDEGLIEALGIRDRTAEERTEYVDADKALKAAMKARYARGETRLAIGDWYVEGTQDSRGAWRTKVSAIRPDVSSDLDE